MLPWPLETTWFVLAGLALLGWFAALLFCSRGRRWLRFWGARSVREALARERAARSQVELRLRESDARFRAWLEASSSVLWLTDPTGGLRGDRAPFCKYSGMLPEAAAGVGWMTAVHGADRARFLTEWEAGMASQRAFDVEARFESQRGPRTCALRAAPVHGERGVVEWVVSLSDIEERRQTERELREIERRTQEAQRMESLGVLAGGVAHDFNNLLVGVMGHAEWMARRIEAGSPFHENLQRIVGAAERAAQLCKQMLAFAGRGRFLVEPCQLSSLARDMHALLTSIVPSDARLVLHTNPVLAPVQADPGELRQVLISLVTNAAEALEGRPGGTVTVATDACHLSARELAATKLGASCGEGEYVYIEVSDDGPGIAPEVLPRIFDPFFSTKFMGRGLSLAAVLGIARSHRGTLEVTSELGHGTRVRVFLPALRAGGVAIGSPPPAARSAVGTVLVIDDDEGVRELARLALEDAGATVVTASGGEEALRIYVQQHRHIEAVLLDLTMPGMDGAATLRELRAIEPEVRVVLSSGYPAGDAIERIGLPAVQGFVQKPWRPSELVARVSGVLSRSDESVTRCA